MNRQKDDDERQVIGMSGQTDHAPSRLVQQLTEQLGCAGFWNFPHMRYFVRSRQEVRDVVGWRRNPENAQQYALYFGVWVPEFEDAWSPGRAVDESTDIRNLGLMHDLAFSELQRPAFWWHETSMALSQQTHLLQERIAGLALPYFDTFASVGDVAEMVFYDQRYHNSPLEQRLINNPYAAFFNYEIELACEQVDSALKPLRRAVPAFTYSGGYYWRRRGEVFDVIVPRYMADWRFVEIRVMVWHPALDGMDEVPQQLPEHFSQVAWRSFTENGEDASQEPPVFLGRSAQGHVLLESALEGLRTHGLAWLERIHTRSDVFAVVRPEFQRFYPEEV